MEQKGFEPPEVIYFSIPKELLAEFEEEVRIVVRFPWIVGIPIPEFLWKHPEVLKDIKEFDVMLVPKEFSR